MDDSRWERWGALGGAVFAVLIVVAGFLPGSPPKTSDPPSKIVTFVNDHYNAIRWQSVVGAVATFALLWFLGSVWRVLRRAEGGSPRLTVVAVIGAVFASVMGAVGSIFLAAIGLVGVAGAGGRANLRVLYILATNLGFGVVLGVAVFLAAFGVVILRSGVLPRWLGWVGLLFALTSLVSVGTVASTHDFFLALSFVSFIGTTLWLLVVSVMMFAGRGSEAAASTP